MTQPLRFTAIIEREGDGFVSLCPELDIASQGTRSRRPERIWQKRFLCSSRPPAHLKLRGVPAAKSLSRKLRSLFGRLRVLSGSEVCRILERNRFVAVRLGGSHRIMQKRFGGTAITVPVPLHDALKRGTLSSIVRQSELPRAHLKLASELCGQAKSGLATNRQHGYPERRFTGGIRQRPCIRPVLSAGPMYEWRVFQTEQAPDAQINEMATTLPSGFADPEPSGA